LTGITKNKLKRKMITMIDALKTIKLATHVDLHLIQSKKFKTDLVNVYFLRPLTMEEATLNALLTRILDRGTAKYPNAQILNQHLDNLYGMSLVSDVTKVGERHQVQLKIQFPRSPIIGKNLMVEGLELLKEAIYKPLVDGEKFQEDIFELEKQQLKQEIESKINDKTTYAVDRCLEMMCETEPYRFYAYGDVDYLETVTNEQLYKHYLDVIHHSKMDFVIIGDFDFEQTTKLIQTYFDEDIATIIDVPEELINVPIKEVRIVNEPMNIQQGKLVIGYRTYTDRKDEMYYPMQLFSAIFGGTPSSKLFMNLREKESLCYFIGSKVDKLKGIMYVVSGIDFDKYEIANQLIDAEFKQMLEGNFNEEDIEMAKKSIVSSLKSISDYPNSFSNFYYNQYMLGDPIDIEQYIANFEVVTKEAIIQAGKRIQKDIIYFLKGSEA
jgi:predicted Zn-dependent peptidase